MTFEQIDTSVVQDILRKAMTVVATKNNLEPVDAFEYPLNQYFVLKYTNESGEVVEQVVGYDKIILTAKHYVSRGVLTYDGISVQRRR